MTQLITVPTFTFEQGDIHEGYELPVSVLYYNGRDNDPMIVLSQEGREVLFTDLKVLKKLVRLIGEHQDEAKRKLNK